MAHVNPFPADYSDLRTLIRNNELNNPRAQPVPRTEAAMAQVGAGVVAHARAGQPVAVS